MAKNSFEPILIFQLFIYELGGTLLDYASSEKDLGVIVNTTLTFDDRYSTMNQKLGLLRRVCYFTKDQKQKRTLFLAIVRSQLNHCCVVWRPANDSQIDRLECVQKKTVKWILNEQYHHYNDWEYPCRLRDLDLLPIKYFFILNDLIIFHKFFHDCYFIKLPFYFRPYNDDDRGRLRSLVAPPDYYNSQRTTLDLGSMRAVSYDAKSLKSTLSTVSPSFKRSFFLPCPFIMDSPSYMDKRGECSL